MTAIRSDGTFADGRHRTFHHEPCGEWGTKARLGDETWEPAILAQLGGLEMSDGLMARVVAALGSARPPVAIERGWIERRLRDLALEHAAGSLDDADHLARAAELWATRDRLDAGGAIGVKPARAVEWLRAIRHADVPVERAEIVHAIYDRIVAAGPRFVSARLTPAANEHGLALALPEKVVMARPTGFNRADAISIRIPIEGAGAFVDRTA